MVMEKNEIIHYASIIILLITAVLHVLAPVFFGMAAQAIFLMIGGIVYIALGIVLLLKNDEKVIRLLGFLVVVIGLATGITMMLLTGGAASGTIFQMTISFIYIILAIIVIVLRVYLYLQI